MCTFTACYFCWILILYVGFYGFNLKDRSEKDSLTKMDCFQMQKKIISWITMQITLNHLNYEKPTL